MCTFTRREARRVETKMYNKNNIFSKTTWKTKIFFKMKNRTGYTELEDSTKKKKKISQRILVQVLTEGLIYRNKHMNLTTDPKPTIGAFPNVGVSLSFLRKFRNSPKMKQPLYTLGFGKLTKEQFDALSLPELRTLSCNLRTHSHLSGNEEFALYEDESVPRETWIDALESPPITTTQITYAIIKPETKLLEGSYASTVLKEQKHQGRSLVGIPTDFVSHAWQDKFSTFVDSLEAEAKDRDRIRANEGMPAIAEERYYWNDIFVEDQNQSSTKEEGYFFTAFRQAIESIGRTVLVLGRLKDPNPLTRAWCIWEIFSSAQASNCELCVSLPPLERVELRRLLGQPSGGQEIFSFLTSVHAESSDAFSKEDVSKIHSTIKSESSFNQVDSLVCESLRNWLHEAAMEFANTSSGDGEENEDDARNLHMAAKLLFDQGEFPEAEPFYRRALEIRERVLGADHEDTIDCLESLASLTKSMGKADEAEKLFLRLIELQKQVYGENHVKTLRTMAQMADMNYGTAKDRRHKSEALELLKTAHSGILSLVGIENKEALHIQQLYGACINEKPSAEALIKEVIDVAPRVFGEDSNTGIAALNDLVGFYRHQERNEEALVPSKKLVESLRRTLGHDHPNTLIVTANLASLLQDLGRPEEAEPLCRFVYENQIRKVGAMNSNALSSGASLGRVLKDQDKFDEAAGIFRKVLTGMIQTLGKSHYYTRMTAASMKQVLSLQMEKFQEEIDNIDSEYGYAKPWGDR